MRTFLYFTINFLHTIHKRYGGGSIHKNHHAPSTNYGKYHRVTTVSDGYRYPKDVIKFTSEKGFHPTQKPVSLLEYLIKTYTNEGETVLDNCMGSGSTCVACINTNRHYIGFEIEPKYYDTACKRIEEAKNRRTNNETQKRME